MDGGWSRAVKGVERHFVDASSGAASPSPISHGSSIPGSQLPFVGKQVLRKMPKMVPKVVSVEIVPELPATAVGLDAGGLARLQKRSRRTDA